MTRQTKAAMSAIVGIITLETAKEIVRESKEQLVFHQWVNEKEVSRLLIKKDGTIKELKIKKDKYWKPCPESLKSKLKI